MTNGGLLFWWSYAVVVSGIALVSVINVLNGLQEARSHGLRRPPLIAALQEGSSTVVIAALVPAIWLAARRWPLMQPRWVTSLAVHWACATAFSVVHVAGMVGLRSLLPPLRGCAFGGLDSFFYEYRKDLLSYAVLATSGAVLRHLFQPRAEPPLPLTANAPVDPTFEIRDGARILRTRVAEIAAVLSAGNYVEVKLTDGRNPLMRATLAAMEAQLAEHGFVRTHRSWLVNPARVRSIEPVGSGDHRLELDGGIAAPLSRRYAASLERLRAPT